MKSRLNVSNISALKVKIKDKMDRQNIKGGSFDPPFLISTRYALSA
jgi:hypothetical protein